MNNCKEDSFPHCIHLQTAKDFAGWSSLYGGKIFVNIVAYVDESGTHDPEGKLPGSREAVIGGYAAPVEEWKIFQSKWRTILRKYRVCYFHFYEWEDAFHVAKGSRQRSEKFIKNNPYSHLSKADLDKFILELAMVAGDGNKIVLGTCVNVLLHKQIIASKSPLATDNPYHDCVRDFFSNFSWCIELCSPTWKRMPVSFFFDQADKHWQGAVHDIFDEAKKKNRNFREIAFADKKRIQMLQAADMVAFRSRQLSENFRKDKIKANWAELDESVFKPFYGLLVRKPQLVESGMMISDLLQSRFRNSTV